MLFLFVLQMQPFENELLSLKIYLMVWHNEAPSFIEKKLIISTHNHEFLLARKEDTRFLKDYDEIRREKN